MKALLFTTRYSYFDKHWMVLLDNLLKKGYKVVLLSELDSNISHEDLQLSREITIRNIKVSRSSINPFLIIFECWKLLKILKQEQPSIIHSFYLKSSFISAIVSNFYKSKFLFHLTGFGYIGNIKGNISSIIMKFILFTFYVASTSNKNRIIVETEYLKNWIFKNSKINPSSIKVINGIGIDTEKFKLFENKDFNKVNFIMISRLLRDKGILEYCSASIKINNEFENVNFTLVGEMDEENPNSINKNEYSQIMNSPITYSGYSSEIPELLDANNVFVLPSYFEGLSVSSLEAASSGLCLLLSDIPGCREIVINDINGYTFKRKSTSSLYEAMKKIIVNKEKISHFGKNSRKLIIEKYSKEIVTKQLNEI